LPIQLCFLREFVKNVAARCDFQAQNKPKCVCGRALDPSWKLTKLPDPPSWFSGNRFAAGKGRGREGRRKREGRGRVPYFFFTI